MKRIINTDTTFVAWLIFMYFSLLFSSTKKIFLISNVILVETWPDSEPISCYGTLSSFEISTGLRFSLALVFLVSLPLRIECFEECNPPDCTPIFYKWRSRFTGLSSRLWAGTSRRILFAKCNTHTCEVNLRE